MTAKISASRGVASLGASLLLRITLGGGAMLSALSGTVQADPAPVEASEVTINPTTGAPALTLQGPAFDSASAANYGLVLKYHDSTSTDPKASSVLRILRPTGEYQWQFSTSAGDGRLAMVLGDDHSLTLTDPANLSDPDSTIVLHPGTGTGSGIYWNNQRLATVADISGNYVPFNVGGGVTIGSSTTPANLIVNGTTQTSRLVLPATTDATTGVLYVGSTPFFHNYGADNVFLGYNAGNFGQFSNGTIGADNVAVGSAALSSLTTGAINIAIGRYALGANQDGGLNIAIGAYALSVMTSNSQNIGIGFAAGGGIRGDGNIFIGFQAGTNFTTGEWNTSLGVKSLAANFNNPTMATGDQNTAIGPISLFNITSGGGNTAMGPGTGYNVTTGSSNVLIGAWTGFSLGTGSGNILIGNNLQPPDATTSNMLSIGNLIYGTGVNGTSMDVSTGKIGIGTATPATKLDVAGDATVRGNATIQGILRVPPAGDISMGDFTAGTNPLPPQP